MPKKILLADDSITIQKVVELTFSDGDYEVTAVNNGAKAVAKLAEMRPDIILSDIIMPEKNGYEVCEYVKSHPEYRSIPVVLLTGTFEPFDPDRAEKAGCDAVVTKPFESQSLIHKVEELISQSQSASAAAPTAAAAAPSAPEPAASPWLDEAPEPPPAVAPPPKPAAPFSPFSSSTEAVPALDLSSYTHGNDIFGAAPAAQGGSADMPFDTPADQPSAQPSDQAGDPFGAPPAVEEFAGETRAFPRMTFEEMRAMAATGAPAPEPVPQVPAPPAAPEPSPWDEPPAPAFEPPSFEASAPEPEADAPFGAPPPAEEFSGETRAFTKMSFDDMQQMASSQSLPAEPEPPAAPAAPEPSPWDEPAEPAAFSGETRAFPKMSFDDMQKMAASPSAPAWSPEEEAPAAPEPAASDTDTPFSLDAPAAPVLEDLPAPEPESVPQPSWSPTEPEPQVEQPQAAASPAMAASSEPSIPISRDLSDEQVDRIARRVVELMSDQVVRNIAWEVIPDLAEVVVKERIRQLESEA
jgi:CheY-like chemotaxis protein